MMLQHIHFLEDSTDHFDYAVYDVTPDGERLGVRLYNTLGKEILHQNLATKQGINQTKLSTPPLAKGIYFLTVQGNTSFGSCKVVVQ